MNTTTRQVHGLSFLCHVDFTTVGSKERTGFHNMKLLSVDPGKHTGWAIWNFGSGSPELLTMGVTVDEGQFYNILVRNEWPDLDYLVYEDYKIRPAKVNKGWAHEWNSAPALHIIGALELFARQNEIELVVQQPAQLPVGCGYIGYPYKKGIHVPNNISAIAHGAYWLVKNNHANPRGFTVLTSK